MTCHHPDWLKQISLKAQPVPGSEIVVKSRVVKRNAKNARGLAATVPFHKSRASYFRFARFNTSALYYLTAWHRLLQARPIRSTIQLKGSIRHQQFNFCDRYSNPFIRAKEIVTARQIFGTVLTILRHGTPNFRRVNVSVPNVVWHQCSKFQGQGKRGTVPKIWRAVPILLALVNGVQLAVRCHFEWKPVVSSRSFGAVFSGY